jgi:RNA polymerase sigma-70 factor (ECF subfamily)
MRLTIKQREVFILYYKLGYTMIEIANLLNVSEGTVKSRIHYAKNEFVIFLKDNGVHYE